MSYTDDFWNALEEEKKKKKKKNGSTTVAQSSTKSSGDSYTDEFFKNNILLLAVFSSSSGGDRYALSSIAVTDGVLNIEIDQTQSGQTCDISEWLFCIAVPREVAENLSGYKAVNGWEK